MTITTDPRDPRLTRGIDKEPTDQADAYLVLPKTSDPEKYLRPLRDSYVHNTCGVTTKMNRAIAETYAINPKFYGATYCVHCRMHLPVGEFKWLQDGEVVGS